MILGGWVSADKGPGEIGARVELTGDKVRTGLLGGGSESGKSVGFEPNFGLLGI